LALALLLVMSGRPEAAQAQLTQATARTATEAASLIVAAVGRDPRRPPRAGNPDVDSLFGLALPAEATQGPPPLADELWLLVTTSNSAGSMARAYLLAGLGRGNGALSPPEREQARRNLMAFLPELSRIYDFRLLACARLSEGAALLRTHASAERRGDPAFARGLAAIEAEVGAVVAAVLSLVADRNVDDARRLGRMRLLAASAPRLAQILELKPSQAIADEALAAVRTERNPDIARLLKQFALAILR